MVSNVSESPEVEAQSLQFRAVIRGREQQCWWTLPLPVLKNKNFVRQFVAENGNAGGHSSCQSLKIQISRGNSWQRTAMLVSGGHFKNNKKFHLITFVTSFINSSNTLATFKRNISNRFLVFSFKFFL